MVKATCDFDGVFVEHPLSFDRRFIVDLEKEVDDWKKNRLNFLQQKPIKRTMRILSFFDEKHIVTGRPPYEKEQVERWFKINNIDIKSISTRYSDESSFEIIRKYKVEKIKEINPDAAFEDDIEVLKSLPESIMKILVKDNEVVIL